MTEEEQAWADAEARKVLKWHKTKSLELAFEICQDFYDAMTEEEKEEYAFKK